MDYESLNLLDEASLITIGLETNTNLQSKVRQSSGNPAEEERKDCSQGHHKKTHSSTDLVS